MNTQLPDDTKQEQKLVKLYMDLTGAAEPAARSVLMYLRPDESEPNGTPNGKPGQLGPERIGGPPTSAALAVAAFAWLAFASPSAQAAPETASAPSPQTTQAGRTNTITFPTTPLSLEDVVNIALNQNPAILRAQKDLEATQGVVIQTRAIALPKLAGTGSYGAVQRTDIDVLDVPGVATFGNNQNWATQVRLVQSFYEGGRILSSLRVARLTKQQSILRYQSAVADVVLLVQLAYYDILLDAQLITVQEASVELLNRQLTDTSRRYEAGTVPRFNVLRAEVELANQQPQLIRARNNFRIAKNNLANLLGFKIPQGALEDIPLTFSGKLDADAYQLDLTRAISTALERRPELGALVKAQALRKEDIVNARSGYKPSLQGYVGYDVHNSSLSQALTIEDHGWIAGAQLSWTLFDGMRTYGRIKEAAANYERAGIEVDDEARRIELEVRTMFSNFIEAREVLESQKKVLEQAEEALRLASARYEAGTGTQLDVLSAQTALTDARSTNVQALHDYDAARARLQRAVGLNITAEQAKPPQ